METAAEGIEGLRLAMDARFDLLILDVMLPGLSGFDIAGHLREHGFDGAILMLTARSQVGDRVQGLHIGADDYLIKPFNSDELLARVSALLRRVMKSQLTPVMNFSFGDVEIDFGRSEALKGGVPLTMAAKEWQLLRYLINYRGQVISRERLLQQVWSQQPFITPRTVDVHIAWLRQKLEDDPQVPKFITTSRGEGYRFSR